MSVNKQYKSSVFAMLFSDPERFIELYDALTGKDLPTNTPVELATLTDVLFMDRQNDVAFIVGDTIVVLIEHQSTLSENMPLRLLIYIARIYELIVENETIYKKGLVKIPKPEFIVLYNGTDKFPEEKTLKLSDAFLETNASSLGSYLDLSVRVVNINKGHNTDIIENSDNLKGYVEFIATVRKNQKGGMSLQDAVEHAVNQCIEQDILADFLRKHSSEVVNMLFTEFNIETALRVRGEEEREVGRVEGLKKGKKESKMEIAENLIKINLSIEQIIQVTGLSEEEVMKIKKRLNL
jgi:predicted transposase/invertase (TIGR01784 family)